MKTHFEYYNINKYDICILTAQYLHYNYGNWLQITDFSEYASLFFMQKTA